MARIALVNCSNTLTPHFSSRLHALRDSLLSCGHTLDTSGIDELIQASPPQENENTWRWSPRERAAALTRTLCSSNIDIALDLSGGDLANELLPFLSPTMLAHSRVLYVGYSDNSVIVNALAACGNRSLLWNPLAGLIQGFASLDQALSGEYVRPQLTPVHHNTAETDVSSSEVHKQRDSIHASFQATQTPHWVSTLPWIGGNLRCFLKLAGTSWCPLMDGHAFLMEMRAGDLARFTSHIAHHSTLGTFNKVEALILGQLTQIDAQGQRPEAIRIIGEYAPTIPLFNAPGLGHSPDSEATIVGA